MADHQCLQYLDKEIDLDLTYSMVLEKNSSLHHEKTTRDNSLSLSNQLGIIPIRQNSTWIDDRTVKECHSCQVPFTFYLRKHRCRLCTQMFCYQCSQYRMSIPSEISLSGSTDKVRVCRICAQRIITIREMEKLMSVFDLIPLTVNEYRTMTLVSRKWNQLGNYYLSRFREIQYKLPNDIFSTLEKRMLWNHRFQLAGHNLWVMNYYRSGNIAHSKLLTAKKQNSCRDLMCSRLCREELSSLDLISLLSCPKISELSILQQLKSLLLHDHTIKELSCYLPLLVHEMYTRTSSKLNNSSKEIGDFLIHLAQSNVTLACEIFWEWKIKCNDTNLNAGQRAIFSNYLESLLKAIKPIYRKHLEDSERLIIFLNGLPRRGTLEQIQAIFVCNQELFKDLRLPTHADLVCQHVVIDQISIKDSASRPIFVPFKCYHQTLKKSCDYYLLYKFEDVRQDQIVLKTIGLMNLILNPNSTPVADLIPIITYKVLPVSCRSGLIEIIPNCQTLFEIQKNFSIFNYILENNRHANLSAHQLRLRFLRSCAAYCVITYLLGVGDRHLDNIMVTQSGYLFHIDYGFIIGSDPKPLTNPTMRITTDMVDAIGGEKSQYYRDFIKLSQEIHHTLRRRLPTFLSLLNLLVEVQPPIKQSQITSDALRTELLKRFMYGETYEQAQMQLCVQLASSSQNYNLAMVDFFHYHQRENTVQKIVTGTMGWLGSWLPQK